MLQARRWLYLTHRWLGIVLCLFFAMWFVSGVVMMYVGYPKLTPAERLARLPALDPSAPLLPPRQALAAAGLDGPLQELRLAAARGGAPVYLAVPQKGSATQPNRRREPPGSGVVVIDARTGAVLTEVDEALALASAAAYAGSPDVGMRHLGRIQEDAYTHSRALDAHRPLQVVALDDPASTRVYVSGRTGEVVRDATLTERGWNLVGAWIHWLYPFRGNVFDRWWSDIVVWLSIAGVVVALLGTVVGILRWRFRQPYRHGGRSPYPTRAMRWHHVSGLLFAGVTLTWIFSGLMSMNPWRMLDSGAPPLRTELMNGGPLRLEGGEPPVREVLRAAGGDVRELRWVRTAGQTLVLASAAGGRPTVLDAATALPYRLDTEALLAAASKLVDAPVLRVEQLGEYDLYYYARDAHTMGGGGDKPLPVWRIVFDDPHRTWVHIDPHTGAVLGRLDDLRRVNRWVFAMLHSWDWLPLLERRPLWDLLLILLSLGGTVLSLSGVVIGWRRLGRRLAPRRASAPNPSLSSHPAQLQGADQFPT